MSDVVVKEGDFPSFFDVPFAVYPPDSHYVSPLKGDLKAMLDPKKNPFFENGAGAYFTAFRDRRPVGRILAHVFRAANERWGERAGSFGFFDCADDETAARALLEQAAAWNRAQGMTLVRGNMNMTAAQEVGVVVGGFEHAPMVGQVWNPPHIPKLLQQNGFRPTYPMTTFKGPLAAYDPESSLTPKHRAVMADPAYTFRTVDMKRFAAEVEVVREVLNDSMANNKLFVPITRAEMKFQLGPFEQVADPSIVWIAEHDGVPVGATLTAPNINPLLREMKSRLNPWSVLTFLRKRRRMTTAVFIIIVVKQAYQAKGIIGVLNYHAMSSLKRRGYSAIGGTWIADTNRPSLRQVEHLGMRALHRVELFERDC